MLKHKLFLINADDDDYHIFCLSSNLLFFLIFLIVKWPSWRSWRRWT